MTDPHDQDIEAQLARLRRTEPEKDERFWVDFTRNVRLEYDRESKKPRLFSWRFLAPAVALAAAVFLVVHARTPKHVPREVFIEEEAAIEEDDFDTYLGDLDQKSLERVARALGVAEHGG
jgi:hypothetical protein